MLAVFATVCLKEVAPTSSCPPLPPPPRPREEGDVILVFGASPAEAHIEELRERLLPHAPHITMIGIATGVSAAVRAKTLPRDSIWLEIDFNKFDQLWRELDPYKGGVSLALFDHSVVKFMRWDKGIVGYMYRLLAPGGVLLFPDFSSGLLGHPNYVDGFIRSPQAVKVHRSVPNEGKSVTVHVWKWGDRYASPETGESVVAVSGPNPIENMNLTRVVWEDIKKDVIEVNIAILEEKGFTTKRVYAAPYPLESGDKGANTAWCPYVAALKLAGVGAGERSKYFDLLCTGEGGES